MSLEHAPSRQKRAGFLAGFGGERLLKIADAAMLLGVVTRTIERWHATNADFPRIHYVGNRRFLKHGELMEFIASRPTAPEE
jgi:hypothetical protein